MEWGGGGWVLRQRQGQERLEGHGFDYPGHQNSLLEAKKCSRWI